MHNQESIVEIPASLASLQAGREALSANVAKNEMHGLINGASKSHLSYMVRGMRANGFPNDFTQLSTADLLTIDAIGIDVPDLLQKIGSNNYDSSNVIAEASVEDDHLVMKPYGEGVTMILSTANSSPDAKDKPSSAIADRLEKRLARSPAHQAMTAFRDTMDATETVPQIVQLDAFDPNADPLGTLAFLSDIGLTGLSYKNIQQLQAGASFSSQIKELLDGLKPYDAERIESETTESFQWGKGAVRQLDVDKETGFFTFSARQSHYGHYNEVANQKLDVETLPFVESQCAAELCDTLDRAGLMLHPQMQMLLMEPGEAERFGSPYADITRTMAKWVDDPDRFRLSELVVPRDERYLGVALVEDRRAALHEYDMELAEARRSGQDIEKTVRAAFSDVDIDAAPMGEAAHVLLTMMKDCVDRDPLQAQTDLPVTKERIEISNGSCFDVVSYYIGAAAAGHNARQGLSSVTVGNVAMLEKPATQGKHTFLSQKPLTFNGVKLPKGSLFVKEHDGWALMRITPFAFDSPEDQLATGSEINKALEVETKNVRQLGGVTLSHLIAATEQ